MICDYCDKAGARLYDIGYGFTVEAHEECMVAQAERQHESNFADYWSGQGSLSVEEQYRNAQKNNT